MSKQLTKLTLEEIKSLVIDYDNGNGPGNIFLSKKYNITPSTVRNILIREKVYRPVRGKCAKPPDPFKVKKIRAQNRLMKNTLRNIIGIINNVNAGPTLKHIKTLALSTVEKCNKETRINLLYETNNSNLQ